VFGIEWSEYAVIAIVALIVIGPKELPAVLRAVGQWTTKIRRMASEFQGQFQEALREAEMADLKKEVDSLNTAASGFSQFDDPIKEATKWEAKPDGIAKSAEASSAEASSAEASSAEAPQESALVAPGSHPAPPSQAGEGKPAYPSLPASDSTIGEESFPLPVDQSIEQPPTASSSTGKPENGGGAAEATVAPPPVPPPLSQDSGQKGSEGGVRS
jgi:sec-independent protein translocase protein TatB